MISQFKTGRLRNLAVAIMSVTGLLLTHAAAANAEDAEVPISIEVYSSDPCIFETVEVTWSPELFVTYLSPEGDVDGRVDIFLGPNSVDITHENFFTEGTDSCGAPLDYGTLSTAISVPGFTASMGCDDPPCLVDISPYTVEGIIFVTEETPLGPYTGTLTVTWTPAS